MPTDLRHLYSLTATTLTVNRLSPQIRLEDLLLYCPLVASEML